MLTRTFPNATPGRRYSIAETCELLEINRKTLRKWTEAQMIHAKAHTADRHLFYEGEEINRFWNQTI